MRAVQGEMDDRVAVLESAIDRKMIGASGRNRFGRFQVISEIMEGMLL